MRSSYKLISHPLNSNPFTGSFVNYAVTFRLLSVTLGNQTFCEMEVSFLGTQPVSCKSTAYLLLCVTRLTGAATICPHVRHPCKLAA